MSKGVSKIARLTNHIVEQVLRHTTCSSRGAPQLRWKNFLSNRSCVGVALTLERWALTMPSSERAGFHGSVPIWYGWEVRGYGSGGQYVIKCRKEGVDDGFF